MPGPLVGVIDEGTTFARFLVFAAQNCELLTYHQNPIKRYYLNDERLEQDPRQIFHAVIDCIEKSLDNLRKLEIDPVDIVTIGITNQRETTIVWDGVTGAPLYNAIVWLDIRASLIAEKLVEECGVGAARAIRRLSGIPPSCCTFATQIKWLIDNVPAVQEAIKDRRCKAGTVDSWLIWNLTGGQHGGNHLTDVTNASRTGLMSLKSLAWDSRLLKHYGVPLEILPQIKSCSELYGHIAEGYPLQGVCISGVIGDQQAALYGQGCVKYGDAHITYGTGCFILCNTGSAAIIPEDDLITTVAYKSGPEAKTIFALEGSTGLLGEALHWLKQNNMLSDIQSVMAMDLSERGDVCFIPALYGLLNPVWCSSAKGFICGITSGTKRAHITRAAVDAICQAARCVVLTLSAAIGEPLQRLIVSGAIAEQGSFIQAQADACRIPLVYPLVYFSVALGAAAMAGSAKGIDIWPANPPVSPTDVFKPIISKYESDVNYERWLKGVRRNVQQNKKLTDNSLKYNKALTIGLFMMGTCVILLLAKRLSHIP